MFAQDGKQSLRLSGKTPSFVNEKEARTLRVLTNLPNAEVSQCQKWTNEDYAEIIIMMLKPLSSLL